MTRDRRTVRRMYGPQLLDEVPGVAEARGVGRAQPEPLGVEPVELGLDQRQDLHAVDRDVVADHPVDRDLL